MGNKYYDIGSNELHRDNKCNIEYDFISLIGPRGLKHGLRSKHLFKFNVKFIMRIETRSNLKNMKSIKYKLTSE